VRDVTTYVPDLGMVRREMPDFFMDYFPLGRPPITTLRSGTPFWEIVDWTRSRAYSLCLGQIYFNLKGREGQGIVSDVYKRHDVCFGPYIANAPDLQVGFADGYRVSWQTSLVGTPPGLLYPNMRKWSGDHCSFDCQTIPGSLLSNRKLTADRARIIDIAPTVLKYFGLDIPKEVDGTPLF